MALSKEEILDAISEMSVIDIVELIEAMEEKFGVSAAAPVAAAAPAAAGGADAGGEGHTEGSRTAQARADCTPGFYLA